MSDSEETARIKINALLAAAGWRFFSEGHAPANIQLGTTPDFFPQHIVDILARLLKHHATS
jgi:hypothetical protein